MTIIQQTIAILLLAVASAWADFAPPNPYYDLPEYFFGNQKLVKSPKQFHRESLMAARVSIDLWSDSYWPTYRGGIAARYGDLGFPSSYSWKVNHEYILKHPATKIVRQGDESEINALSPAEKYDLLVGDSKFQLTDYMWQSGKYYYDKYKKVEEWMGLCHGWAPASYLVPSTKRAVTLATPHGKTQIKFFPADIRALNTLLWANAAPQSRFIGSRCEEKTPRRDSLGRVINPECFDSNPGTFHVAIVNKIGVYKLPFIMDANSKMEVWNYPIIGYSYKYFNPKTGLDESDLEKATIELKDFEEDKFRRFRAPGTQSILGIAMTVIYGVTEEPTQALSSQTNTSEIQFRYDLELDQDDQIVGGEWYSNDHPDFLWDFPNGAEAFSMGDGLISSRSQWTEGKPIPTSWQSAALISSHSGQPLARILKKLVELSQ